jgi:UDP-N-acetylglucosamine 3-dehydrogenase
MLKVGLVGAGLIGQVHARAYGNLSDTKLAAVADIRPDRATAIAEQYGAAPFATLDDLLAGAEVDVIDVCLPTPLHAAHSIRALGAGKHVFCEKPIARTMGEARQVQAAARAAAGKFTVGHVVRFFPEYVRGHDLVQAGQVGKPGVIRTMRGGAFPPWSYGNWMGDLDQSGGVILDVGCHEFDWLRWCFGEVTRVFARGLAFSELAQGTNRDHAMIILRFASGAMAHVEVLWSMPAGSPFITKVEVAGDRGMILFDNQSSMPIRGYFAGSGPATAVPESPLAVSPFQAEIGHFLDCIREARQPLVGVEDAVKALEISLAALESARSGKPVVLGGAQ